MTEGENTGSPSQPSEGDLLAQVRDEMQQQFQALRTSFEAEISQLRAQNEQLIADNKGLQAALVRSAVADPPKPAEPSKTEEELYQEEVDAIAKKTLERMKRSYTE